MSGFATRAGLALLAGLWLGGALAQTADEQLLAAQMAFQDASSHVSSAKQVLKSAEDAKKLADGRLADAQAAAQKASADLAAAQSAKSAADSVERQATQALNAAWQRKESGG